MSLFACQGFLLWLCAHQFLCHFWAINLIDSEPSSRVQALDSWSWCRKLQAGVESFVAGFGTGEEHCAMIHAAAATNMHLYSCLYHQLCQTHAAIKLHLSLATQLHSSVLKSTVTLKCHNILSIQFLFLFFWKNIVNSIGGLNMAINHYESHARSHVSTWKMKN